MDNVDAIKIISIISGIYEVIFGLLLIFWIEPLLSIFGAGIPVINYPIFGQTTGLLSVIFGLLMIISFFEMETFYIIPLISIFYRIGLQFIIFLNIGAMQEIMSGLVFIAVIELIFAIITAFLFIKGGLPVRGGSI